MQAPPKIEPETPTDYFTAEMLALGDEYGEFRRYLRSDGGFDETEADLEHRFREAGS